LHNVEPILVGSARGGRSGDAGMGNVGWVLFVIATVMFSMSR
jgi:hypothetical protein